MEEKDVHVFGSTGNSDSGQPLQPIGASLSQVTNMAVNMNLQNSGGATVGDAATMASPATTGGGGQGSFDLFGKKKRGRPRKYDSDGKPRLTTSYQGAQSQQGFSLSPTSPSEFSSKRGRGRPPGSGNWKLLASLGELFANTAGGDFTPHVVTVHTGEDVAGKILSFAQKGPRGVCVLSANGAISNVTLRQPGSSGGLLTYEGRFEILSLSGSFTVSDNGGIRSRTGGLSVSLAGPDGRVIGGGVAGLLTAASPIQIVMGSFLAGHGHKAQKRKQNRENTVASPVSGADSVMAARPISQANPDGGENCFIPMAQQQLPEQSHRESDNITSSDKQSLDATPNACDWNGFEELSDQGPTPDINISLPGE
ncbi:AT-hook motif nuclear-localized protein 7-like [Prosopis cineraria]|uniref:AT-hook motif nuclear-localized protein 7-like n=1 Tax=Prosopis cineraria TaxID=364024 RepID=UPI00240E9EF6|nr:AT-hook motif nuclear-localized protein 7-like [Prosopis cineraria]XP_054800699.1 AT-hook motif nuclear-localized protein 7-like [Prosopis cineraria]